jgi:hypothetical protein
VVVGLGRIAATFHCESHHLKGAVVLITFMPWPRGKYAQGVLAFRNVAQLEWLIDFVVRLVRLIVENYVNVISLLRRWIFVRHVALQIAAQIKLYFDSRARDRGVFRRRNDLESGVAGILFSARLHHVSKLLRPRDDRQTLRSRRRRLCSRGGVGVLARGSQPTINMIETRPARKIRERFGILIYLRFNFE